MTPSPLKFSAAALNMLAVLAAATLCLWSLLLWYRYHMHIPWKDTLPLLRELAPLLDRSLSMHDLPALLQPHYTAHRVLIPRLLLIADIRYFAGMGHVLYLAGWLATVAVWVLFCGAALRGLTLSRSQGVALGASALILLVAPANLWNLFNPINTSWPLSIATGLAALYLLVHTRNTQSVTAVLGACVFAGCSALTNFAGVLVWLLIPAILVYRSFRHTLPWIIICLAVVILYSWNIQSDAAIALSNTTESSVTAGFREEARSLLENLSPWIILQKSVVLLGWPLYQSEPAIALFLSIGSLLCLGVGCVALIRSRVHNKEMSSGDTWLLYCVSGALLCLGIVLSIYLGRVLPYPDEVHGPSPERYQTVVSIYWIHVLGTAMALLAQKSKRIQSAGLVVAVLLAFTLVFVPRSAYLENEFKSLAYGAALFQVGESATLTPRPISIPPVFTPRYAFAFNTLFEDHRIGWHGQKTGASLHTVTEACSDLGINIGISGLPQGPLKELLVTNDTHDYVSARSTLVITALIRDIEFWGENGFRGRLSPLHIGDYSPLQLMQPTHSRWVGAIPPSPPLTAMIARLNMVPGWTRECRL